MHSTLTESMEGDLGVNTPGDQTKNWPLENVGFIRTHPRQSIGPVVK
jgi:hypothetical protein